MWQTIIMIDTKVITRGASRYQASDCKGKAIVKKREVKHGYGCEQQKNLLWSGIEKYQESSSG